MFLYGTNTGILRSWLMAYDVAGEAMLPPFGLSASEIDAVITASSQDLHDWSGLATPLVRPRMGLLRALRHDLEAELMGCIADGRTPESGQTVHRLPRSLNRLVLETWCAALRSGEKLSRFELDADEIDILSQLSPQQLNEWSQFPVAIAVPKPGLIKALCQNDSAMLFTFVKPCVEEPQHAQRAPAHRRPGATRRRDLRRR